MKRGFRIAHLVVVSLILAAIVAQPFLIGLFLFGAVQSPDIHAAVGYALFEGGIPLLLITALLARLPRNELLLSLLLIGDILFQEVLVGLRDTFPVLAALHPLNAFALLWIAVALIRRDLIVLRSPEAKATAKPLDR
jgi:hypothetical protein